MTMLATIKGKKTYALLALGAVMILANKFLGLDVPGVELDPQNWLNDLFALGIGGTLRNGMK